MIPRIGILFLTSGWFRQVGLQSSSSSLSEMVEEIATEIITKLKVFADIEYHGIIFSEEQAGRDAGLIGGAEVDGLILAPLMWCEDQILVAALQHLQNLPILLCTFMPDKKLPDFLSFDEMLKGSGSVGTLQMSGYLKRAGYLYRSVSGYYKDKQVYDEIETHCKSFLVRKKLSTAICGVLPYHCDQMLVTHVNDEVLNARYGIRIKYLQLKQVKVLAQSMTMDDINDFKRYLSKVKIEVSDENLNEGVRYALALEQIVASENLDILAINDVCDEIHESFGLRPCLENPHLTVRETVICMEADASAGIAMYLIQNFTGKRPFYSELLNADLQNNALLMGHAGYHNAVNADPGIPVKIIPDIEYKNAGGFGGACTYFKFRPGPVTAVNCIFDGDRLRFTVFEGESMPGSEVLEGNSHLLCKINLPIKNFYKTVLDLGVSQHWIVVPGHHAKDIGILCDWLDMGFFRVES